MLLERLDAITGTGWDRDRLVKVTVAASGVLADVDPDERVGRHANSLTRRQILAAAQAAQLDLAHEAAKITAEPIGMKHPTADAIVRSFTQRLSVPGSDDAR